MIRSETPNLSVWKNSARGEEVALPNFGLETVHHVHPDDVAQAFELTVARGRRSLRAERST